MAGVGEHLIESKGTMRRVFDNPSLRRLNFALAGSVVGDWAFVVAMSVYAYQRGGATTLGTFGVVRYLTLAVLAPFVSVLADRLDRRRLMVTADLVRAALVGVSTVIVVADGPAIAVYALSILCGVMGLAFRPAQCALLPSLARTPSELTAANVAASTITSVGSFIGPLIAGGLLAVTGLSVVFVLNAVSFVWSAAMVAGVRPVSSIDVEADVEADADADVDAGAPAGGMLSVVGGGFRTILGDRNLRLIVALYTVQTVIAGASMVYDVAIVFDLLDLGQSGVGIITGSLGVGGLFGGGVALVLSQRGKLARDFGLGVVLWGAPLLLVAGIPSLWSALVAMALIGLGNSIVDVNAETILQRIVPNELLGRVFGALDAAAIGGMALGAGLMPILIHTIGLRSGLVAIGVATSAVVLLALGGLIRIDKIALAPDGLELLRGVPMLSVLPEHVLELLARRSELVSVNAGDTVFREGDHGDRFYVIERGEVDVSKAGASVGRLGQGDSFGEIALLRDVPRTGTITALGALTLRSIDRRHFLPAVTGHAGATEQAELVVGRYLTAS